MFRLMLKVFAKRLLLAVPTLLALSLIVFVVLRLIPADPLGMLLPPNASKADVELLEHQLGLDRSIAVQFFIWVGNVLHGDLGNSIAFQQGVGKMVVATLPATLELCAFAFVLSLLISVPGGVLAYSVTGKRAEFPIGLAVTLMQSIPSFLWALLLIALFGVVFPILPFSGRIGEGIAMPGISGSLLIDFLLKGDFHDWLSALRHLLLPSFALAFGFAPMVIRVLRSSLIDQRDEPYVATARLRGVSERRILWRHMLKNAALPTLTLIGVQFGFLLGGALLVEMIFSYPGIGNLMIQAVRNNDLSLIQGIAVVFCALMLLTNALVDSLYVLLDPRMRKRA